MANKSEDKIFSTIFSGDVNIIEELQLYKHFFQLAGDSIVILKDGRIVELNEKTEEIFGYSREEMMNKSPVEFSPGKQPDGSKSSVLAKELSKECIAGKPQKFEWVHIRKNNKKFYAEISLKHVGYYQNNLLLAIIRDISDKKEYKKKQELHKIIEKRNLEIEKINQKLKEKNKQLKNEIENKETIQQELSENEEKFRLLYERSSDPILFIDQYDFIDCNQAALEKLKLKNHNEIYKIHPGQLSPQQQPDGKNSMEKAKQMMDIAYKSGFHRFDWLHKDREGNEFYVDVALTRIPFSDRTIIFTVWRDITIQKHYEQKIIENERKFRDLFNQAADGILVGNQKGNIIDMNNQFAKITGYDKKDVIGKNISLFFEKEELNKSPFRYDLVLGGKSVIRERNMIIKSGKKLPVEMNSKKISDGRLLAFIRDISPRIEAEEIIRINEQKFRNIFNSSQDAIVISSLKGELIEANRAFFEILEYNDENLKGQRMIEFILPEERGNVLNHMKRLENKANQPVVETEMICKSGKIITVELNNRIIDFEEGKAVLTIGRDVTERKNMEKKLFDTIIETEEKERARIAGDLHDEIGPVLSSLKMYTSALNADKEKEKLDYIIHKIRDLVSDAIKNVREISNTLSPHILTNYGILAALKIILDQNRYFIKINLDTNLENTRFQTNIEIVFYRVIKELINNTIKHAEAKTIFIKLDYDQEILKLEYNDDGKGFDLKEVLKNQKRGIGLFNILNRAKTINGRYSFETQKNRGIKFILYAKVKPLES